MIREATPTDIETLRTIERAAGQPFADIGMTFVAEDEPPSRETLLTYIRSNRAWTYVTGTPPTPVAYLLADIVDGNAHLEQVSVHPSHARQGIGLALLNHLVEWSRTQSLPAITLTTYTEVPWNAPYYTRHGFHPIPPEDLTSGLKAIRKAEAAHGLDQWPRTCMLRTL